MKDLHHVANENLLDIFGEKVKDKSYAYKSISQKSLILELKRFILGFHKSMTYLTSFHRFLCVR